MVLKVLEKVPEVEFFGNLNGAQDVLVWTQRVTEEGLEGPQRSSITLLEGLRLSNGA